MCTVTLPSPLELLGRGGEAADAEATELSLRLLLAALRTGSRDAGASALGRSLCVELPAAATSPAGRGASAAEPACRLAGLAAAVAACCVRPAGDIEALRLGGDHRRHRSP